MSKVAPRYVNLPKPANVSRFHVQMTYKRAGLAQDLVYVFEGVGLLSICPPAPGAGVFPGYVPCWAVLGDLTAKGGDFSFTL